MQVWELRHHVVFPGDDEWSGTEVNFVQHYYDLLLQVSGDVVVQVWRKLQHLEV